MRKTAIAHAIAANVAADNTLASARLIHPRANVAAALRMAIAKGTELRNRKLRYQEDLDEARADKLKWTQATNDLLHSLFDNSSVADYCNDWVGKIFPEFAALGNFIEQFYEEMEHRLGKLQIVLSRVEPDASSPADPMPIGHTAPPVIAAEAPMEFPMESPMASPVAMPLIVPAAQPHPQHPQHASHAPHASHARPARAAAAAAPAPAPRGPAIVTHPAAPVAVPHVLLLGAPIDDPVHAAAADLLKRLQITTKHAADALAVAERTDAAVFIVTGPPSDASLDRLALFQLGCAVGRLGAPRVCVLLCAGATPLHEAGVTHIPVDANGGWQLPLLRHLKKAGVDVDLNRLC